MKTMLAHQFVGLDSGQRITCYRCETQFIIPTDLYRARKIDHHSFWCPLGHEQHFPEGKTKEERLRERVEMAERDARFWRDQKQSEARRHAATKGQVTKLKNRAKAGVCPCCDRSFVQLARHIATKHPDFQAAANSEGSDG